MSLVKQCLGAAMIAWGLLASGPLWAENPRVRMETSHGNMVIELYPDKAPQSVANFLRYVDEGFYRDTIFHRVIKGFMIQGGGYTADYQRKNTHRPVENEADNGLRNDRGTLAMARTSEPHSATSQFFINSVNNDFLNYKSPDPRGWGYTVFGKVVEGMETVDRISALTTGAGGPFRRDVPREVVTILAVARQ